MRTNRFHRVTILFTALAALMLLSFTGVAQAQHDAIYRVAAAGNYYAAASFDRTIRLWNVDTGQLLLTIPGPADIDRHDTRIDRIGDLDFSPDGTLLAASFGGGIFSPGIIRLFDTTTGDLVKELDAWSSSGDIAWKPDGTQLASRAQSGAGSHYFNHLMIWDIPSGKLALDQDLGEASSINIAWSPDGSQLATADGPNLYLSDTTTWSRELKAVFPPGVTDITWNNDGKYIAGVNALGTVYIVDTNTWQVTATLPGTSTQEYLRRITWSSDNRIAATSTGQVLVWDAATGTLIDTLDTPDVVDVAWLANNDLLIGSASDSSTEPQIATVPLSGSVPKP